MTSWQDPDWLAEVHAFEGRGTHAIAVRAIDEAGNVAVYPSDVEVQTKE